MDRPTFDPVREREFVARGWWADDTLTQWIARHAAARPEASAVIVQDYVLSWRALQDHVLRVAEGLRKRGVVRGDVVAVQLPNSVEFIIAFLAITRLGAVMSTLHMPYRAAEVAALTAHSAAKAAFCTPQAKEWFPSSLQLVSVAELQKNEPLAADYPEPDPRDPFLLLYTSGTTAAPKGVVHPYRTMLGNARLGVAEHKLFSTDRILSPAPFSHLYGLYSLHCAFCAGACTVVLPAFKPEDLSVVVEKQKPTALWTAPAHVAACRAAGLFDKHDWSSLKLAIVSGSMAPPQLMTDLAAKLPGCAVTQLWGMTELQAGLYTRPDDPFEMSATTAGRPSPGTEARVSEEGELQVRGPLMFSGYYKNEEANHAAFTGDGWFRTGDLAEARGEYFAITGRSKDIINRGGVKFNPADVEMLLDSHPKLMQSAIVPMPDPVLGERACAFITLRNPKDPVSLDEVVNYLLEKNIAKNKVPERLVIIPEMPLTPTRKIIKGRLRIP
jgi:cyclohexanecarboxylate-CoA ligase